MQTWTGAFAASVLPDFPALDPDARNGVERRVAAFLVSQPRRAAWHIRVAVAMVAWMFLAMLRLRHPRRGFVGLDPSERRDAIARWEHLCGPARAFVRLYRSLALLAWFEDPVVLAALECPARSDWRAVKQLERAMRGERQ